MLGVWSLRRLVQVSRRELVRFTLDFTRLPLPLPSLPRSDHMPVYSAFNSRVARFDVDSRAQVWTGLMCTIAVHVTCWLT